MTRCGALLALVLAGCDAAIGELDAPPLSAGAEAAFDAGAPDAAVAHDAGAPPLDAGLDAGAPPSDAGALPAACPTDALLCESFESGLDPARWRVKGQAATFTVDTATAADGNRSLKMSYGVPFMHTGEQVIELRTPPAAPDDRLYLRVYLRFGDLSLPGAHPSFVDVTDGRAELGFGSISNDFAMMGWGFFSGGLDNARAWYEGGSWHPGVEDGDATPGTEQGFHAQRWLCLEAMYFGDHQGSSDSAHPNEEVKVWLDGVERPELNLSDALWRAELGRDPPEHWSPVYEGAAWRFGLESFGPANVGLELWFDSIVFSHHRIGCLP
ncbi:MAG: hypothetical protein ACOZQL_05470 [Myxococcota bacterium]